jgi:CRISPR-associated protein Cas1
VKGTRPSLRSEAELGFCLYFALNTDSAVRVSGRGWPPHLARDSGAIGSARRAQGLDRNIARLSRELMDGSYRLGPLRLSAIDKPGGGCRKLAVPPIRDRVAQSTALRVLAPLLDAAMSRASFAYRAGLEQAAALVMLYRLRGFSWVVDGDIADFFPSILHAPLLTLLAGEVDCRRTRALVAAWLKTFSREGRGLAQGSPLSPLLSNLALSPVDQAIDGKRVRLVRDADDFLLMTRTRPKAEAAAERIQALIRPLGLTLNRAKTRVRAPGLELTNPARIAKHL